MSRATIRLQGIGILLGLIGLLAVTIGTNVSALLETSNQISASSHLIERYEVSLSRPVSQNPYRNFEAFIWRSEAGIASQSADIQSAVVESLSQKQARMLDLRQEGSDVSIQGLEALVFKLNFEGDLQAILDVMVSLSEQPWPIVVEAFNASALGPESRPDRRMRVAVTLKVWGEADR